MGQYDQMSDAGLSRTGNFKGQWDREVILGDRNFNCMHLYIDMKSTVQLFIPRVYSSVLGVVVLKL